MSVNVKDGTPVYGPSLCETCVNAHVERGYRETDLVIFCQATYFEHGVRFRVRECSNYVEKKRQRLKDMEEVAWVLMPRDGKRVAGFVPPEEVPEDERIEIEVGKSK
ncbi:MAG: hypothetical protein ACLP3K_01455 [Candidatus Acidiferrales bacterium]